MWHIYFFFIVMATTQIYTLSEQGALAFSPPVGYRMGICRCTSIVDPAAQRRRERFPCPELVRSEEHTSELQSPDHLVCPLLLEKKKTDKQIAFFEIEFRQRASVTSLSPRV